MITLVRVSAAGEAEQLGRIEAQETFWSPDGSRLAYIRPASAAAGGQELVLAGTDGADPQVVSALQNGQFLGWSPDGRQFLYADDYEVYAGGPGRKPEHLGNIVSLYDPRWAAPGQIVSLLDQGTGWMLVWRNLDTGESASLASLPKEISWDFVSP
jgi:Tol biopolymer transport system component